MKQILSIILLFISVSSYSQETITLFKEAANFEYNFKEQDALNKYKQILIAEPNNIKALVKATDMSQ